MLKNKKINRGAVELINTDDFVPKDHLLRRIDKAVRFEQIYVMVEAMFCQDTTRASIDPIILFKLVLIQRLYGLPTLRRTSDEVQMNVAYRWFLGYAMGEKIPHYSSIRYSFLHRITSDSVEKILTWILDETNKAGLLDPEAVLLYGAQTKASAYVKKRIKEQIPQAAKIFTKQMMDELNNERQS